MNAIKTPKAKKDTTKKVSKKSSKETKNSSTKEVSREDMNKELLEVCREQFNLRVQQATKQLTRTHLLKLARRKIARLKTILHVKTG